MSHSRCNDYGYGENVAGASNNLSGRRSTQMWYDEVKYYRYGSGFSGQTGNYVILMQIRNVVTLLVSLKVTLPQWFGKDLKRWELVVL